MHKFFASFVSIYLYCRLCQLLSTNPSYFGMPYWIGWFVFKSEFHYKHLLIYHWIISKVPCLCNTRDFFYIILCLYKSIKIKHCNRLISTIDHHKICHTRSSWSVQSITMVNFLEFDHLDATQIFLFWSHALCLNHLAIRDYIS